MNKQELAISLIRKITQTNLTGLVAFTFLTIPVHGQANISNFNGLEKISARCVASTKRKIAARICGKLADAGQAYAEKSNISYNYAGINPPQMNDDDSGNARVLRLTFYVRGTDGKNLGVSVRIEAGVEYSAAVEKDAGNAIPRSGILVLWDKSVVAEGPARKMSRIVGPYMASKMKDLFDLVATRER